MATAPSDADAPACDEGGEEETLPADAASGLSKRAMKRAARHEAMLAKKKAKKAAEKAARREAKAQARAESQEWWDALPDAEKEEHRLAARRVREERQQERASAKAAFQEAVSSAAAADAPTVVIDCSFDDLMNEREIVSLAQQLSYSYCAVRRAGMPVRLSLTSHGGALGAQLRKILGSENWAVERHEQSYRDVFASDAVVYLSSESDEVLGELEPGTAYVVGGLVDHNRHKGLTHRRAGEAGVRTARLPIEEHMQMSQRRVLAVNHCVEILAARAAGGSWTEALLGAMPQRRGATLRGESDGGDAKGAGEAAEAEAEDGGGDGSDSASGSDA